VVEHLFSKSEALSLTPPVTQPPTNKHTHTHTHTHTHKIKHSRQVGFITSMQDWFDIRKSINVTHHINRLLKNIIISTDKENIFKMLHLFMILKFSAK
jgi:hypothetical protein